MQFNFKHKRAYKLTRYIMYQEIAKYIKGKTKNKSSLFISSGPPISELFENKLITSGDYPKLDIQKLEILDKKFDFVVADQVLEHVANPFIVPQQVNKVLNSNGICIITTVFSYFIHNYPKDYYRFSTDGLKELFCIFRPLVVDSYGNPKLLNYIYNKRKNKQKIESWHNIKDKSLLFNDSDYPIVTWIICQK